MFFPLPLFKVPLTYFKVEEARSKGKVTGLFEATGSLFHARFHFRIRRGEWKLRVGETDKDALNGAVIAKGDFFGEWYQPQEYRYEFLIGLLGSIPFSTLKAVVPHEEFKNPSLEELLERMSDKETAKKLLDALSEDLPREETVSKLESIFRERTRVASGQD